MKTVDQERSSRINFPFQSYFHYEYYHQKDNNITAVIQFRYCYTETILSAFHKGPFTRCVSDSIESGFTVEVFVAVEVTDTSVRVNRSICCHRNHCLRRAEIGIVAAFGASTLRSL